MSGKETCQKILDATLEVIAREKISGTRMHLIAKEAGMIQSNLHYYYPTKNDLLIALLDDLQDKFSTNRRKVVNLEEQSFLENFQAILAEKKADILQNQKLDYVQFDYWVQGTVNPEIRATLQKTFDIWRNDIAKVFAQGRLESEQARKVLPMLPYLMVSLMMGASMQYLIAEGQFDLDAYFDIAGQAILKLLETA